MPEPTNHLATINTMIAAIDAQPYSAADQRARLMLVILRDMLAGMDATDERLAELEAWREQMTGDGR